VIEDLSEARNVDNEERADEFEKEGPAICI